ncbi:hypothetical protein T484DRAFT_3069968 [Baffinella frigidus]|nr:hypothetical protein T484DRAFT_3069968 [Cryptophyta sp. CCMP2293]
MRQHSQTRWTRRRSTMLSPPRSFPPSQPPTISISRVSGSRVFLPSGAPVLRIQLRSRPVKMFSAAITEPVHSRLAPAQFNMRREASVSKDMAKLDEVCDKFWVEGWQIVRPSGNPLTYESQKEMFLSPDVKFISSELVGINSTKVFARCLSAASLSCARCILSASHVLCCDTLFPPGCTLKVKPQPRNQIFANGAAAVVVYTTHDKFEYKGTANDDIAVFSVHPKP